MPDGVALVLRVETLIEEQCEKRTRVMCVTTSLADGTTAKT
jgi:hypothetical protein